MGFILWIVFGGVVGWIATIIMGKDGSYGVLANILFGIVGSVLGGYIFGLVGEAPASGFSLWGTISAIVGAVVVVYLVSLMKKSS